MENLRILQHLALSRHVHGLEVFSSMLVSVTALPNVAFHGMGRHQGRRIALLVYRYLFSTYRKSASEFLYTFLMHMPHMPSYKLRRIAFFTLLKVHPPK